MESAWHEPEDAAGIDVSRKLYVLVVEDNRDCADSTALLLRLAGHEAEVAPDGASALRAAAARQPDVVLLDLGLPDMTGWEVARRLKALAGRKGPFIVAVTGWSGEKDRLRSADS